jgi:hypothetical protein
MSRKKYSNDVLTVRYSWDYDINIMNTYIHKVFNDKLSELPNKEKLLQQLTHQISTRMYAVEFITLSKKIESLRQEIDNIKNDTHRKEYDEAVGPLLKRYSELKKIMVIPLGSEIIDDSEETRERLVIIKNYLNIASKYVEIDVIHNSTMLSGYRCQVCDNHIKNFISTEYGFNKCPECKSEYDSILPNKISKDMVMLSKEIGKHESHDNFIDTFIRYQGLQIDVPPIDIYKDLDSYFVKNGKLKGEDIRKLPLDETGKRGNTSISMLESALSSIGRSQYYKDMHYIAREYWGWTLPKLMHLQNKLSDHFVKTEQVYNSIPIEVRERSSSLGKQFRLYVHLLLLGHKCSMNDFKIAKNTKSLNNHFRLWRMMCEGANDPDIYYMFPS